MPDFTRVRPDHVLAAMAECDRLGDREFLARYKFGRAPAYTLWHHGQEYDSKAILGVALLHATGRAPASNEFSGGRDGAAKVLEDLGFDVVVDEELVAQTPVRRTVAPKPARRVAPDTVAPKICPRCFMALPATGICDTCD